MSGKKNILERAYRPLELCLIAAVCVIFLQVLAEVVSRYVFSFSIAWGQELAETLIVWVTFIGAAVAMLRAEHMAINILYNSLKNKALAKIFTLVANLTVFFFLVCSVYSGTELVRRTWEMKTVTMEIPAGVLYLAFPVGCALMLIVNLRDIFLNFRRSNG
ncbi:MAG: TRAP transporter small permease [Synergistaceae bacterium]|nr:TRAP transporter small permease [Synergistaceae bacterium]